MTRATTRLLGVVGWPVTHSLSPAMQGAALRASGLDLAYAAFAVAPPQLAAAIRGAAALGFAGLNVTLPHKQAVLALCDADVEARLAGGVNTLVFDAGAATPRGLNTDGHGFRELLRESGIAAAGARVALLGAGGAARAVALALREAGAFPTVVSRSGRRLRLGDGWTPPHIDWEPEGLARLFAATDLLVDATARGLDPTAPSLPVERLPDPAIVVDIVARTETALTRAARGRGLRAVSGLPMLLHQGARAFEAWTGRAAPIEVMRRALDEAARQG